MPRYFRIQPAGLEIASHRSVDSMGERGALHVFELPLDTLHTDGGRSVATNFGAYGDEVVVIEAAGHVSNGDVEGVAIDPAAAIVVDRYPIDGWIRRLASASGYDWDGGVDSWDLEDLFDELRSLDRNAISL